MEEEIGDISREHLVINLSAEQEKVLNLLYTDPGINGDLNHIASSFGQDKDDLRQKLAWKLGVEGYTLHDVKCLKSWCHVTATNLCKNDYRHDQVVKHHSDKSANESVQGKRGGGDVVMQRPAVETPEQQMLRNERRELLPTVLNNIVRSLPEDVRVVARLWDEGDSPATISMKVGKSVATVYRKLEEFQRVFVEEIGDLVATTDEAIDLGLQSMISDSLHSSLNSL